MIPFLSRSRKPRAPSHLDVTHEDRLYRVAVKRVSRARRFTLRVNSATRDVTLSMPMRADFSTAIDFVHRHGAWIAERVERLGGDIALVPGAEIPLRGQMHLIVHRPQSRGTVWVESGPDAERLLVVAGAAEHVSRRVRDFLKKHARHDLDQAVARHTNRLGIPARHISVKDTKSRWGSCSSTGRLNFSWRLILAPPEILDYLAAHEVAHLKEHNHSASFWRLVDLLYPDHENAEAWLKRHGMTLHRYR